MLQTLLVIRIPRVLSRQLLVLRIPEAPSAMELCKLLVPSFYRILSIVPLDLFRVRRFRQSKFLKLYSFPCIIFLQWNIFIFITQNSSIDCFPPLTQFFFIWFIDVPVRGKVFKFIHDTLYKFIFHVYPFSAMFESIKVVKNANLNLTHSCG